MGRQAAFALVPWRRTSGVLAFFPLRARGRCRPQGLVQLLGHCRQRALLLLQQGGLCTPECARLQGLVRLLVARVRLLQQQATAPPRIRRLPFP